MLVVTGLNTGILVAFSVIKYTFLVEGYFKIPKITKRNETTRRNKERKSWLRIFGIAKVKGIRMKYK